MIALDPQLGVGIWQAKACVWYTMGYTQPGSVAAPLLSSSATLVSSPAVVVLVVGVLVAGDRKSVV